MADGITGVVHLSPEEGDKVRGAAAGLGTDNNLDDITRPELCRHVALATSPSSTPGSW